MPPERIGSRYGEVESACSTSRTLTLWTESESPSSPPHTPFVPPPIPAAPRSRTRLGLRRLPPGTYLGTSVPTEAWGRSPVLHLPTRARFVVAAPSRSPRRGTVGVPRSIWREYGGEAPLFSQGWRARLTGAASSRGVGILPVRPSRRRPAPPAGVRDALVRPRSHRGVCTPVPGDQAPRTSLPRPPAPDSPNGSPPPPSSPPRSASSRSYSTRGSTAAPPRSTPARPRASAPRRPSTTTATWPCRAHSATKRSSSRPSPTGARRPPPRRPATPAAPRGPSALGSARPTAPPPVPHSARPSRAARTSWSGAGRKPSPGGSPASGGQRPFDTPTPSGPPCYGGTGRWSSAATWTRSP